MFVLIGCPVYQREWILPTWLKAIEGQDWPLQDLGFIFEVAPDDHHTVDALLCWHGRHPEVRCFELSVNESVEHKHHPDGHRVWSHTRYQAMADMRNRLLDLAICHDPDRYFSLDSDVVLEDKTTITQLVSLTESLEVAAPLTFMTPEGDLYPNVMSWIPNTRRALRMGNYPLGTVFRSDVVMAAKMMTRPVYQQARYEVHSQGEDLGWSKHCGELGFQLWSASHIFAAHVMHKGSLEDYLTEGDKRSTVGNPRSFEAPAPGAVVVPG